MKLCLFHFGNAVLLRPTFCMQVSIRPWTDNKATVHSPPPSITAKSVKRDIKENFYRVRYKLKNKSSRDFAGLS